MVHKGRNLRLDEGIFTLSLDTELAWGMVHNAAMLVNYEKPLRNVRGAVDGIIRLLDEYQIPATWAMVGALLMDEPAVPHELVTSATRDLGPEIREQYFKLLKQRDIWCGRDIFEKIKSAKTPHEIGSHGFHHLIMDGGQVTREEAAAEFIRGKEILEQLGENPASYVFPANAIDYLDELSAAGFLAYRGLEPDRYRGPGETMRKVYKTLEGMLALTPEVVTPAAAGKNLVDIPASMFFRPMGKFRRHIPLKTWVAIARKGVRRAADEKAIFHLWFHPHDVASGKNLLVGLGEVFERVQEERVAGRLKVMTMGQVAARFSSHPAV